MAPQERLPIEIFMLALGLFILFMPYIFSGLFVLLTDQQAQKDSRIPKEPRARLKWMVMSTLRGAWLYFVFIIAFMVHDIWSILSSLFTSK